ncbi:MAG: DUF4332 domain-containing protein [Anaerolineae bacterium]|nr:DUF4332 domain-containing protein [Anaerolineae bacterium]
MENDYYINLKSYSLDVYAAELEQAELLPSRKMLQEDLPARFAVLKAQGLNTLDDLLTALKTPPRIKALALQSAIPEEYLILLKREIGSCFPKTVNLQDFPDISSETIKRLAVEGIHNTYQLFDYVKTAAGRQALSLKTGINKSDMLELTRLTDLCRIRWVGANFARLLVDSDFNTVKKVSEADYAEVYRQLMTILEEKQYFKGKFGLNDMKLTVLAARLVPDAIQYDE